MPRNIFGWSLPPGCGRLPGEEPEPPSCDDCPEERFDECPGIGKCQEVYLDSNPACCIEHRIEMVDGLCHECEADMWASLDTELSKAEDRVRVLRAGLTAKYPKRIEKLYLHQTNTCVLGVDWHY